MRILHVLPSLNVGGAETLVVNYLVHMKKKGHDVALVTKIDTDTSLRNEIIENDIKLYNITPLCKTKLEQYVQLLLRKVFENKKMLTIIRDFSPEVVHFHLNTYPNISQQQIYRGIKLFYTYHSDIERYISEYGDKWRKSLQSYSKNGKMTFFAINKKMQNQAATFISDKRLYLLYNGVSIQEYSNKTMNRVDFLDEIGYNSSFIIGHIGRLDEVKNQKMSIQILKEVIKEKRDAILLLVGTGTEIYRNELREYAAKIGVLSNVFFLGFRKDINEIISILDVAILPSFYEGFPLTVLEYQAHRIRTIVSEATPEVAICNKNCFRLRLELGANEWCKKILGNDLRFTEKDLMYFDQDFCVDKLLEYYKNENFGG